jgi:hypothetical protein
MKESNVLPIIARTPFVVRWGVLVAYIFICIGLLAKYFKLIESSTNDSWLVNILLAFTFCIFFPISLIIMFFAKTIFYEDIIEHTNHLLIKRKWIYKDIAKVETSNTGHIRITFVDGKWLKISRGETDLSSLLLMIKSKNIKLRLTEPKIQRNA